jgi:Tfp pilus assembly protein PilO
MKRGPLIAIIGGAVVLILLWYLVLFSPTSSDLKHARADVAAAQSHKQELENTIRRLTELSKNAPQQQASLNALKAGIPPNPDLGGFILQANDIASTAGIDWLSIAPAPPVATIGGQSSTIAVSMQIDGGFFQVLDYLNRLEDLPRLVIVDTISVSAGGATANTGTSGSTGSVTDTTTTGGAPDLSVTLTGRMFTTAPAPAVSGGVSGGTTGGTTTTPTPTTPTTTASSSSSTGAT